MHGLRTSGRRRGMRDEWRRVGRGWRCGDRRWRCGGSFSPGAVAAAAEEGSNAALLGVWCWLLALACDLGLSGSWRSESRKSRTAQLARRSVLVAREQCAART